MKRYTGWQRYLYTPDEPDLEMTNAEVLWWDNEKAWQTHATSLGQAAVVTATGLILGALVSATIQWGLEGVFVFRISRGTIWATAIIGPVVGWIGLSRTRHKQMLKTKRLRDAMQLEQDDAEEQPRELLP